MEKTLHKDLVNAGIAYLKLKNCTQIKMNPTIFYGQQYVRPDISAKLQENIIFLDAIAGLKTTDIGNKINKYLKFCDKLILFSIKSNLELLRFSDNEKIEIVLVDRYRSTFVEHLNSGKDQI